MRRTGHTPHRVRRRRAGQRGWRVRWSRVMALLLGVVLAGGVASLLASTSQAAGPPAAPAVVVVEPGDTLWSLAARHMPSRDPYGVIDEIRRLNDLPDHTVHPGQELVLP